MRAIVKKTNKVIEVTMVATEDDAYYRDNNNNVLYHGNELVFGVPKDTELTNKPHGMWNDRVYEIAKEVLPAIIAKSDYCVETLDRAAEKYAKLSVHFAKCLLRELKK